MSQTTMSPGKGSRFVSFYMSMAKKADKFQSLFLLCIRVYIGYQCIISGWSHLQHIDKVTEYFASLHIPTPKLNVIMSATTELVGGALLIAGFGTRLVSLFLVGNFVVAILSVQLTNFDSSFAKLGHAIWEDQSVLLNDTAFPFLATSLIVLIFGPGFFALDGLIKYFRGHR